MQWPGAYCEDSDNGCCVPKYGYPAEDFFVKSLQTFDLSINKPIVRCRNGKPFEANKVSRSSSPLLQTTLATPRP
jgi:ribonuclease T2